MVHVSASVHNHRPGEDPRQVAGRGHGRERPHSRDTHSGDDERRRGVQRQRRAGHDHCDHHRCRRIGDMVFHRHRRLRQALHRRPEADIRGGDDAICVRQGSGHGPRPCQPYAGDGEGGYSRRHRDYGQQPAVQPGGDRRGLREGDDRGCDSGGRRYYLLHYRGWQEAPRRGRQI